MERNPGMGASWSICHILRAAVLAISLLLPGPTWALVGDTCPSEPAVIPTLTKCVIPVPLTDPVAFAAACTAVCPVVGVPLVTCFPNLEMAATLALPGDTIGVFGATIEPAAPDIIPVPPPLNLPIGPNVDITGFFDTVSGLVLSFGSPFISNVPNPLLGSGLRIEDCSNGKIQAGDPTSPVIDIAPGAGTVIINSLNVSGGSIGILVRNNATELKAIRAYNNFGPGIQVTGNGNMVTNSMVSDNIGNGLEVTGSFNTIESTNRAIRNSMNGFVDEGTGNSWRGNIAEGNGLAGFLLGPSSSTTVSTLWDNRARKNGTHGFDIQSSANSLQKNKAEWNILHGFNISGDFNTVGVRRGGNTAKMNVGNGFLVSGNNNVFDKNRAQCNGVDGISAPSPATSNLFSNSHSCGNQEDEYDIATGNLDGGGNRACNKNVVLPGQFVRELRSCFRGGGSGGTGGSGGSGGSHSNNKPPKASLKTELLTRNTGLPDEVQLDARKSNGRGAPIDTYTFVVTKRKSGEVVFTESLVGVPVAAAVVVVTLPPGDYEGTVEVSSLLGSDTAKRRFSVK